MNNNNENKILNVPHLRFPEFNGEWIKKTFDESVDYKKGKGLSRESTTESGSECILYGDLYTIYKDNPIITNALNFTNIKGDYILSKENDVIVPSSGESALDISSAGCVKKSGIILGGDLNILSPKNEIHGDFLTYQIRGARKIDIAKVSQGISVVHLNYPQFSKVSFYFPKFDEQIKVSTFFNLINKRIEVQRKLIDLYKSLIKTLREKLFSFQSNNLLGNEINFINGYAFSPKTYDINGKYYVCTISNVSGDKYLDLTQVNRVSEIPKDLNINQQLFSGDILMSLTGNVGRISIVEYDHGLLNQRVAKIDVKNKDQSNFIYHVLSSEKFLKYVERQSQGSSQNNLYYKNIEKFALPNYDSNKRLLSILDKIDFLIINYSTFLQSLIAVKIFLLHNMFI